MLLWVKIVLDADSKWQCDVVEHTGLSLVDVFAGTRAWYHRTCLESMAYSAGLHFFKCPLCNNMEDWQAEMMRVGIYIPDRWVMMYLV